MTANLTLLYFHHAKFEILLKVNLYPPPQSDVIVEGNYRESLSNVFQWVSSISSGDHDYASFVTRTNFGPAGEWI